MATYDSVSPRSDSRLAWDYLAPFCGSVLHALAVSRSAQIAQLGCNDGYLLPSLFELMPDAHVYGVDASRESLNMAARRAPQGGVFVPTWGDGFPSELPATAFSHAFAVHPTSIVRTAALDELVRLVAPHGQVVLAMPGGNSYLELFDLLREFALKKDANDLAAVIENNALSELTLARAMSEMRVRGLEYVEGSESAFLLAFESSEALFSSVSAVGYVLPELAASLGLSPFAQAFSYVGDAIDKYWSDGTFTLSVEVMCVTGRKRG